METRPILLLLGLLATAPAAAQAYKWVDEDGVTHYSDIPREGAERVELSEYSRDTGARLYRRPPAPPTADQPAEEEAVRYQSLSITSPSAGETLWNIEGVLNVSVSVSPQLQPGHQLQVYFDGQPRIVSGTSFTIDEVYRGVHRLQAEVLDEAGRTVIRSRGTEFYVRQNTIANPGGN